MTVPLRAALYLRVSTARQAEHDVSIPDQKRQHYRLEKQLASDPRRRRRKAGYARRSQFCSEMAVPTGFEPVTFGLGNRCSILLSYGTAFYISLICIN
jgi:hypothetical protein